MADALVVQVAQAAADALNAAALPGVPVAAARSYLVVRDLPVAAGLRVTVVPAGYQARVFDNEPRLSFDCAAEVWFQQRLADATNAAVDPLVALAQAVVGLFLGRRLAAVPGARCVGAAWQPAADRTDLDTLGLFSATVSLTFRVTR